MEVGKGGVDGDGEVPLRVDEGAVEVEDDEARGHTQILATRWPKERHGSEDEAEEEGLEREGQAEAGQVQRQGGVTVRADVREHDEDGEKEGSSSTSQEKKDEHEWIKDDEGGPEYT